MFWDNVGLQAVKSLLVIYKLITITVVCCRRKSLSISWILIFKRAVILSGHSQKDIKIQHHYFLSV